MVEGFESLPLAVILQVEPEPLPAPDPSHPDPPAVGLQFPRVGLVAEGVVEDAHQSLLNVGVVDGHDHLHPTVQVALHQVGRADPHPQRAAVDATEAEDPRVLEVPADDGADPDRLGQPGHPGPKAAPAPDDQIHRGAGLRSPVEGVDDARVGEAVGLEHDAAGPAGGGLRRRWPSVR